MNDIVERLRFESKLGSGSICRSLAEAADEIGRLQTANEYAFGPSGELAKLRAEIERQRLEIARLTDILTDTPPDIETAHAEIERLQETDRLREVAFQAYADQEKKDRAEIDRLRAYAAHERSLGAEGPTIELMDARQEIERLQAEREECDGADSRNEIESLKGLLKLSEDTSRHERDGLKAELQASEELRRNYLAGLGELEAENVRLRAVLTRAKDALVAASQAGTPSHD